MWSVGMTTVELFIRLLLAKARGVHEENFRLFLNVVPLINVIQYVIFYLKQKGCSLCDRTYEAFCTRWSNPEDLVNHVTIDRPSVRQPISQSLCRSPDEVWSWCCVLLSVSLGAPCLTGARFCRSPRHCLRWFYSFT